MGSIASIKKAASPIVAVNTATKDPKEIRPWIYCVTTIIAPPHPGIAPKKAAIPTWNFCVLDKKFFTSNFVKLSNPIKTKRVNPTKTDT